MDNILNTRQSNGEIYNWMAQIQSIFYQYIMFKNQLEMLEDRLKISNEQFDKIPTTENLNSIDQIWKQKFYLMQEISNLVIQIISSLTDATGIILTSMQTSINLKNNLGIILNDTALASIHSLAVQNQYQLDVKEMYRQSCLMQNIPMLLNDIEIKAQMMRLSIPNFDNLKLLIRGY